MPVAAFAAAAPAAPPVVTVAADGSGQFRSVQAAVDSLPAGMAAVVRIRPGVYRERLRVGPEHPGLILKGDGPGAAEKTLLTYDLSARSLGRDGKPVGTTGSASVTLAADGLTAQDLTFENAAGPGTKVGQAVAVKVLGDRCAFYRCRFLGSQDTLYASAAAPAPTPVSLARFSAAPDGAMPGADRLCRQYYRDCYIEGGVDFVFGSARAVFDRCTLRSNAPGAVTAHARTGPDQPGGYVFKNCDLTAAPEVPAGSVLLGRPWRPYAHVVFLNCRMGAHINPKGWGNWDDPAREKTAFYAESGCTGPGAGRAARVPWSRTLTPAEVAAFAPRRFLAGADAWDPEMNAPEMNLRAVGASHRGTVVGIW